MRKDFILGLLCLLTVALLLLATACQRPVIRSSSSDTGYIRVEIYKGTPAWDLAKAVKGENITAIDKIAARQPELLNYMDPKYDVGLLLWAVGMEKYDSAEALLRNGADPDIASERRHGETPLYRAAGYSWIDNDFKKDPKYVKLLLAHGADPNLCYRGDPNLTGSSTTATWGRSPLMQSIGCGVEKTKALVEAGADINYRTFCGKNAAAESVCLTETAKMDYLDYPYYLIVEKKADVTQPSHDIDENGKLIGEFYPVVWLKKWAYPIDSKEYQIKMEIVKEFERQGVDYHGTKIPKPDLERIQEKYPDTWEEYIEKY